MDLGRLTGPFIARFLTLVIVVAINWHLLHDATKSSEETALLPNITIIGTGGTIAGATNSPDKTTDYEAGIVQIDALTQGIDEAWRNNAVVHHEQFMSVDSININSSLAISLSQHVTKVANNPYTQGIVLAHGTDLMPEMAMFLSLTVTSRIPIVMTGAMWPHTAFSADGPGNIIAAVKTAATIGWSSEGREVVIVIQGKVMAPWATKKDNNQFLPGPGSLLGDIKDFEPLFRWLPGPCTPIKFDISELSPETPLPEVVIFQAHQDFPAYLIEVAISMGVRGIVLVGYGDGYWPAASAKEIRKLVHESGVVVVFAAEEEGEVLSLLLNSIGLGLFVPVLRPLPRYFTSLGLSPFVAITVLFAPWIIYKAITFMCGYLMVTVEISPGDLVRAAEYLSIEKASWGRDNIAMLSRTSRNELEIGDEKSGEYTTFSWRSMQKIVFYPLSSSWFWADGKLFRIQGRRVTDYYNAARSNRIEYSLSCFGNSAEPIKKVLQTTMNNVLRHERDKTGVWYPRYQSTPPEWTKLALRASRPMETLAIDSKIMKDLLADIDKYLKSDSMKYYHKQGIPYRRGYLLHGPPGTGKTSLVHVLASVFRLPIFCLSLCAMVLTDESLVSLTTSLPRRGILLIEDIDSAGLVRTSSGSEHGVTVSGYLNATDGFSAPEGHILVITTNNRDSLDPAILRPGRVDYEVHLTNASRSQIEQLFRSNYRSDSNGDLDSMAREFAGRVPEFQFSPAQIQQYLLRLEVRDSPETAIVEISAWVSEHPEPLGL
ncbi:hypothetical protein FOQG_17532 [Fusarium oxysporum f. sp. raphani 54005]|uniref:asparaginase n=2 Tax=Fusarium oxysporum f. sp. raphani TaxID=96318 RepID=X0BG00_FUSOX|nr:hypothetical protein FOQG_17532 [Fusarium oxysporum f. sp. raphani 54005]